MKKIYLILLAVLGMTVTSCLMEEKELFDKTPAERMDSFLDEYHQLLASAENGWLLQYYPEEEQSYGGYAYVVKFTKADATVWFQLDDDISTPVTSLYKMTPDDGPVLAFDMYNENLHFFATPDVNNYEALHGDYEFRISGKSEDGNVIYMKGRRSGCNVNLVKFSGDPVEYLTKCNEVEAAMTAPSYAMAMDGVDYDCTIVGNVFEYTYTVGIGEEATEEAGSVAFCYTPDGVDFYNPIEIAGVTYEGLVYNAADGTLATEDGKIVIRQIIPPLNELFILGDWYITFSNVGTFGKPYFNVAKNALAGIGEQLLLAYFSNKLYGTWGFNFYTTTGAANYKGGLFMAYELIGEDKIAMQFAMAGGGDGVWYHNNASFNYILNVFGYNAPRTFTITADDPKAPSYLLLTEDANPNNTIKLIPTQTLYPFNN